MKILKPAEEWLKEANQELPQFYPLFPFDQYQIGDEEIQVFKNTYEVAPEFRKGTIISWHQDGIFFARMGMTAEAADYNTINYRIASEGILHSGDQGMTGSLTTTGGGSRYDWASGDVNADHRGSDPVISGMAGNIGM